jgi:hypothetical protein
MHTVLRYDLPMETMSQGQWIARCAQRLHQRWRTVEAVQLEEVAAVIWQDAALRRMEPAEAAALWLQPVARPATH